MIRILGISGSLRAGSYNTALLKAAVGLAGEGVALEAAGIAGIPMYDGDLEAAEGIPASVQALKAKLLACDGLLLATPEYNNGIPGPFKNAIDWLSRPTSDIARHFNGKPVAVMGASPGGFGTILSQNAWLPVLRTLGTRPWWGAKLLVSRAGGVFDADGNITDEKIRAQLADFIAGFARFVKDAKGG